MEPRSIFLNFEQFSLDPEIIAAVKAFGYTIPTPIQRQAIPLVLEGRDVMGLAQTGTGKTAAFVLPFCNACQRPGRQVRALILAPTRELAEQIHDAIGGLARKSRVRSVTIYGGVSKYSQAVALRRGVEIVVACPGRLLDHLGDGNIDLSRIEVLVLDEADRMCDMGFLPDIRRILRYLPCRVPRWYCYADPGFAQLHMLACVVHVVAGVVGDQPIVGRIVDAPQGKRRTRLVAFHRVVVDHVQNHLQAGACRAAPCV